MVALSDGWIERLGFAAENACLHTRLRAVVGAESLIRQAYVDPGVAFSFDQSFLPVMMALFGGMGNWGWPSVEDDLACSILWSIAKYAV